MVGLVPVTVAGGVMVFAGAASAHDFHIGVPQPHCVDGRKTVDVQVFNDWSTPMMFTSSFLSGTEHGPVAPGASGTISRSASGSTVGKSLADTVQGKWDDGVSMVHAYVIDWGSQTCAGAPATTTTVPPATTIPSCPPGQVYLAPIGNPAGCVPGSAVAPPTTEAPVTNPATTVETVEATTVPPNTDTSTPQRVAPPRSHPSTTAPTAPTELPTTGDSPWTLVLAAITLGVVGLLLWRTAES